jgi:hypothetical protein
MRTPQKAQGERQRVTPAPFGTGGAPSPPWRRSSGRRGGGRRHFDGGGGGVQRSRERGDTPGERCPVGPSASRDVGGTERLVREETSLPLEPSNRRDAGDEEDAAVRLKWGLRRLGRRQRTDVPYVVCNSITNPDSCNAAACAEQRRWREETAAAAAAATTVTAAWQQSSGNARGGSLRRRRRRWRRVRRGRAHRARHAMYIRSRAAPAAAVRTSAKPGGCPSLCWMTMSTLTFSFCCWACRCCRCYCRRRRRRRCCCCCC